MTNQLDELAPHVDWSSTPECARVEDGRDPESVGPDDVFVLIGPSIYKADEHTADLIRRLRPKPDPATE